MKSFARYAVVAWVSVMVLLCGADGARAQTPALAAPPVSAPMPDDTPSIVDCDGKSFHNSSTDLEKRQQIAVHALVNFTSREVGFR